MSAMTASSNHRRTRALLALGVSLLVLACLGVAVILAHTEAQIEALLFSTNPETGVLVEQIPLDQRSSAMHRLYEPLADWQLSMLVLAAAGLLLTAVGLRRRARETGLKLPRTLAPVLLPIAASCVAGLLLWLHFDAVLQALLELLGAPVVEVGMCMRSLSGCSRLLGHELLRTMVLLVSGLATLLLIPAGRRAWRAGQRGHQLSPAARAAAIVCFLFGSLTFVGTRGAREDTRVTLAKCAHSRAAGPHVTPHE